MSIGSPRLARFTPIRKGVAAMSRGRHRHLAVVISSPPSSLTTLTPLSMQAGALYQAAMIRLLLSRLAHPIPH